MNTTRKLLWNIAGLLVIFSMLLSATFVFSAAPVSAQKEPPQDPQPEVLTLDDPTEMEVGQAEPETSALMNKALTQGSVGVIVVLNVPEAPTTGKPDEPVSAYASAQSELMQAMAGKNVGNMHSYKNFPMMAMRVDAAGLRALLQNKLVSAVQENTMNFVDLAESSEIVGAVEANEAGFNGAGQTVAIIDTGVSKTHSFLSGKVVYEACFSGVDGDPAATSLCPNGLLSQHGDGAGTNCSMDGCEHGTHVAGIAAGTGATFSGVARGASIMAFDVFTDYYYGGVHYLSTFDSDYIKAMDEIYALRGTYNISSVNMSLGGSIKYTSYCNAARPATKVAIDKLRSVNIATVISSGNSGFINGISAPGCISSAISVGSTDKDDEVSYFSNSASFLALLAPGGDIYSSIPGGGYTYMSGTSMAAPHVTGAWAVLRQAFPTKNVSAILSMLKSTGVKVKDYRNGKVKPRINVAYALGKYQKPTVAAALVAPADGAALTNSTPELDWTGVPLASSYKVTIKKGTSTAYSKMWKAVDLCDIGTGVCSLHVPTILKTGTYSWTIQAYSGAGGGPLSLARTFSTPNVAPAAVTLLSPLTPIGYYSPSFEWLELGAPTGDKYTLTIFMSGKRVFNKVYDALKICSTTSCRVPQPYKLKEGDFTWQVTPWNPVGYGTAAVGAFDMHYANGYDNHFDNNLDGVTVLYPTAKSNWWWRYASNLVTWYGLNYTWASARLDGTYGDVDMTAIMYRDGNPGNSNGVVLRGTPTLVGSKDWKNGYEFVYANEGYYSVWKKYNGREYNIAPWTASGAISGGTNIVRAVASGTTLSFYMNGTLVWTGTDTAYGPKFTTGSAGVLSFVADWADYYDYLYIDRVSTSYAAAVSAEDVVSAEQQALNDAAMANPLTGSSAGPNVSMEQYELLQSMPARPEMSFQEKLSLCQASGLPKCENVPLP